MNAKEIEIYSLAEGPTFWAVICNFLGWAPTCTYGRDFMKIRSLDPEEERLYMLAKVKDMGAVIKVSNLFKPFREPEIMHCIREHYDDALTLIRLLIKSEVRVVWDDIPSDEREFLLRHSPPLYSRMFDRVKINVI